MLAGPATIGRLAFVVLTSLWVFSPLFAPSLQAQELPAELTREQVLIGLEHDDEDVRRGAYVALRSLGLKEDLPLLFIALHDRMYQRGVEMMRSGLYSGAIRSFTALIQLAPDFTEAWNKRATLYFIVGEDDRSIAYCEEVLVREPNHFGALSGYGQLMLRKREYQRALGYFEQALTVNPNLVGVSENIDAIRRTLEKGDGNEV